MRVSSPVPPRRVSPKAEPVSVVAVAVESASAKVRSGPPGDDEEDYALPHWAGVLPMRVVVGEAVTNIIFQDLHF